MCPLIFWVFHHGNWFFLVVKGSVQASLGEDGVSKPASGFAETRHRLINLTEDIYTGVNNDINDD